MGLRAVLWNPKHHRAQKLEHISGCADSVLGSGAHCLGFRASAWARVTVIRIRRNGLDKHVLWYPNTHTCILPVSSYEYKTFFCPSEQIPEIWLESF